MQSNPFYRQPIVIAGIVALLHVGGLVALQNGLLLRAYELVVPVEMISQIIEPPQPEIAPPPPPPAPSTIVQPRVKQDTPPPAPQPLAIADPTPAPNAPVVTPAAPAPLPPVTAPVAASPSLASAAPTPAPPAPKVELPRSDADYLSNPPPPYPRVSRSLGEQGRVMLRVCVDEKGLPNKAEVSKSSGFERLDSTAVATALRWRYKPGTRGGIPEAMCFGVPFDFKLD